jgi:outer membrane receptor protein involved in Fe transport
VLPGSGGPPSLPGLYTNYQYNNQASDVFRMTWDHTFRPTLFNHFYAGANNWRQDNVTLHVAKGPWKDKLCMPNVPDCNENLVNLSWSNGYTQWGNQASNGSENTTYAFNDDLSWIKGKHQFKAGGMYQLNHYNGFGHAYLSGLATFNFTKTGLPGNTNFTTAGGNPFASFLLGWVDGVRIDAIRLIGQQRPYYSGYFQDDWRINPKLMLNLGVRWDTTLPPRALNDQFSDFSPTLPNPGVGNIRAR